ncbi:hypothetical protein [Nocardia sp. NPDC049149]|uniref:hypothetical protein n=1 Tax=Nocardia sp. NPDC049149 TaxID=3364315 RepID=UPI00371869A5
MSEPNALLGGQPIHACELPAAEMCPRDIPVACVCGKRWVRSGLIGWRVADEAGAVMAEQKRGRKPKESESNDKT